jgi:hypothetical protein
MFTTALREMNMMQRINMEMPFSSPLTLKNNLNDLKEKIPKTNPKKANNIFGLLVTPLTRLYRKYLYKSVWYPLKYSLKIEGIPL